MGDEHEARFATEIPNCFGYPWRSSPDVVHSYQIRMVCQQPRHDAFVEVILISSLNGIEDRKAPMLEIDDLMEAENAFGVIAQRQRPGDDRDRTRAGAEQAADQRAGRAPRRHVVDADIMAPL